jgi:2-polyprenyl-3-methyl-5-hydroxy-6-metoxy-1,4-benzoquinol methylase
MKLKKIFDKPRDFILHYISEKRKTYYYEDYIRVYPDGINFNKYGKSKKATKDDIINFANHSKFYKFASQFVKKKVVADIGCGSGYGCQILKEAHATRVYGADMSKPSIEFARSRYGAFAEFSVQGITNLNKYLNHSFDVTLCSEVLEHIKEYQKEDHAVKELKRITKPGGIIVIGTPNTEMIDNHGFSFNEIQTLLTINFDKFFIIENSLVPYSDKITSWNERLSANNVGIVITQDINLNEMVLPKGAKPQIKQGIPAGSIDLLGMKIDTTSLRNTHSWIAIAVN